MNERKTTIYGGKSFNARFQQRLTSRSTLRALGFHHHISLGDDQNHTQA